MNLVLYYLVIFTPTLNNYAIIEAEPNLTFLECSIKAEEHNKSDAESFASCIPIKKKSELTETQ